MGPVLSIHPLEGIVGFASLAVAAGYAVLALVAVIVWRIRRTVKTPSKLPPVTVLKPLCGAEPGLYENLRSFCQQDYPEYQIVFGVRDPADRLVPGGQGYRQPDRLHQGGRRARMEERGRRIVHTSRDRR